MAISQILDFGDCLWIKKKLETVVFVFTVNIGSEKLQVSRFYMKSWPNYTMTYTNGVGMRCANAVQCVMWRGVRGKCERCESVMLSSLVHSQWMRHRWKKRCVRESLNGDVWESVNVNIGCWLQPKLNVDGPRWSRPVLANSSLHPVHLAWLHHPFHSVTLACGKIPLGCWRDLGWSPHAAGKKEREIELNCSLFMEPEWGRSQESDQMIL